MTTPSSPRVTLVAPRRLAGLEDPDRDAAPGDPRPPVPFSDVGRANPRAVLLPHLRRPELYLSGSPTRHPMPVVLELFAHHVPLSDSWMTFTDMMAGERFAPRARAPGARSSCGWRGAPASGYEWIQHRRMGADAGLTRRSSGRRRRAGRRRWTPKERALLAAGDEMIDDLVVSDETWDVLTSSFERRRALRAALRHRRVPLPGRRAQQHRPAGRPPAGTTTREGPS